MASPFASPKLVSTPGFGCRLLGGHAPGDALSIRKRGREEMKRREFIKLAAAAAPLAAGRGSRGTTEKIPYETFLRESAVSREVIDRWLHGPSWARFDPELGYVLWNYMPLDGIDGSATISTIQANGARTSFMYAGRKCRINTYGDSFTQCHQVSDGETWQEYLAGHLGEPIRNFGMGGFGVYQAYLRMLREEGTDHGAEYVIFYVWGDDHIRSLLRCRHAIIDRFWDDQGGSMFHGNFWSNLEMDLETGRMVEKKNLLPTAESLYSMTDPQFMVDHLKDDLALQLFAFKLGYTRDLDRELIGKLAASLGYSWDWKRESDSVRQATELLDAYSLGATKLILKRAREFTNQHGKKLLVCLFDPYRAMSEMHKNGTRYDQAVMEYLANEKFNYFDMNEVHLRDFRRYNLKFDEYMKVYFIGHYNPRGNHFFAYSIKDTVRQWLDPPPIPYKGD
jgi:hypothetical protein